MRLFALLILYTQKLVHRVWMHLALFLFRECGRNVRFGPGCDFSFSHIEIGNDVYIGPGARFNTAITKIRIGNKVLFGPDVSIMGGDHRTDVLGQYMYDVKEKLPANDKDVVIEDDVWVGTRAIILKGVTVGRGSIIGAGSVVAKDVEPYTIYLGAPPLKKRARWSEDQIQQHQELLKRLAVRS